MKTPAKSVEKYGSTVKRYNVREVNGNRWLSRIMRAGLGLRVKTSIRDN